MFLTRFFRSNPHQEAARLLYARLVAQARRVEFYAPGGVPDTVDGRFDMVALHAFLVMRRLRGAGPKAAHLSQALFDIMFADMDQNLREMGVGDLSVGKRVKAMAKAFYGRVAAYDSALDDEASELGQALRRNLFRKSEPSDEQVAAMSAYMRREVAALDRQEMAKLMAGEVAFGAPGMGPE